MIWCICGRKKDKTDNSGFPVPKKVIEVFVRAITNRKKGIRQSGLFDWTELWHRRGGQQLTYHGRGTWEEWKEKRQLKDQMAVHTEEVDESGKEKGRVREEEKSHIADFTSGEEDCSFSSKGVLIKLFEGTPSVGSRWSQGCTLMAAAGGVLVKNRWEKRKVRKGVEVTR